MLKRRAFVARLAAPVLGWATCRVAHATDGSARVPPPRYPDFPGRAEFVIREPGRYAFDADQLQRKLSGAGHTGPGGGFMVTVYCGSVDLDLGGHTLAAEYGLSGIGLNAQNNVEMRRDFPQRYGPASLDSSKVSVSNGTIDLARGENTRDALTLLNRWYSPGAMTGKRPDDACGARACPPVSQSYVRNDYRLERLKVFSNEIGIAAEGTHTVIRDCVIEASGNAAIFIAGPNATIENCEIRLRNLVRGAYAYGRPTRAAIVLRDGSNAVIRNNRIRVDYGGWESDTHCILVRDGARDVLVEGNTFINVRGEPVTLMEGAEAVVRNNKADQKGFFS